MKDIILIGASGVAHEIIDTIFEINKMKKTWNLLGIIDDDPLKTGNKFYSNISILGTSEVIKQYDMEKTWFLIVFCSPQNFLKRKKYAEGLISKYPGIQFANIIHPKAYIAETAQIKKGIFLGYGVVVDSMAVIQDHVIILFYSVISRFVEINNYSFISASVNITNNKSIGKSTYLGVNATINANIGNQVLVGAGSVIKKDIDGPCVVSTENPSKLVSFKSFDRMQYFLNCI